MQDPRKALESIRAHQEKKADEAQLPPTTDIEIDVVGTRGKHYKHTFRYTVPTLGQQIDIGKLKTFYLPQGAKADDSAALLVEQIAYLTVTIDPESLPDWWDPMNLRDATPIGALYREVLLYERRFQGAGDSSDARKGSKEVAPGAGQDDDGGKGTPEADVGDGAQPPAQRRKTIVSSGG